jgi:hypothetical protein
MKEEGNVSWENALRNMSRLNANSNFNPKMKILSRFNINMETLMMGKCKIFEHTTLYTNLYKLTMKKRRKRKIKSEIEENWRCVSHGQLALTLTIHPGKYQIEKTYFQLFFSLLKCVTYSTKEPHAQHDLFYYYDKIRNIWAILWKV